MLLTAAVLLPVIAEAASVPGEPTVAEIEAEKVGGIHIVTCEYATITERPYGFQPGEWKLATD